MFSLDSIASVCDYKRNFNLSEKEANAARDNLSIEIPDEDLDDWIANMSVAHG
jgi:hypothetical protein